MVFSLSKKLIDLLPVFFFFCIVGVSLLLLLTVGSGALLSSIFMEQTQSFVSYTKPFEIVNTIILSSAFFVMGVTSLSFYVFWKMTAVSVADASAQSTAVSKKNGSIFGLTFYLILALLVLWVLFSLPRLFISTRIAVKEKPSQLFLPKTPYTIRAI